MSNNNTSNCIELARNRVNWAWEYIKNFNLRADEFIAIKPYQAIPYIHMEGQDHVVSYRLKVLHEVPIHLRLIASDAIHNLGSALDNLAWGLWRCEFPVYLSKDKFDELALPHLISHKVPISVQNLIRDLQPYKTGNNVLFNGHPLRTVRGLWGKDKHEIPTLLGGANLAVAIALWESDDIRKIRDVRARGLHDGAEIVAFASRNLNRVQDFHASFVFDVAFDEGGKGQGRVARFRLKELHNFIRDEVIAKFEPFYI